MKRKDIKETATYALKKRKVLKDDNIFFLLFKTTKKPSEYVSL
jgi:hypothetical protein